MNPDGKNSYYPKTLGGVLVELLPSLLMEGA